jgi:hypothetical protein
MSAALEIKSTQKYGRTARKDGDRERECVFKNLLTTGQRNTGASYEAQCTFFRVESLVYLEATMRALEAHSLRAMERCGRAREI